MNLTYMSILKGNHIWAFPTEIHSSDWSDRSAFISLVTEHLLSNITNDCLSFSKRAQCGHLEPMISNMLHQTLCGWNIELWSHLVENRCTSACCREDIAPSKGNYTSEDDILVVKSWTSSTKLGAITGTRTGSGPTSTRSTGALTASATRTP